MRLANLTTMAALTAAVLSVVVLNNAVQAQPDPSGEDKPLPRAVPLPPPDTLKPGAPADADDDGGQSLPQDRPITMNGIEVVCTGTGSSKDKVDWQSYPVRVEFSNGAAQFLSGMQIKLSDGGKDLADFTCWAPWVLFKMQPGGNYKITASLAGRANSPVKSATFSPPSSGQKRVEIAFPEIAANQ
jgi:hypothetical protein